MVVVTINISVIPLLLEETLLADIRLVLLLPEEPVSLEVPDKSFANQNEHAADSV
jgi:hypothetical protein